jgi:hypothetical protein
MVKLLDFYKGIAQAEAGMHDSILFWTDLWNVKNLATVISSTIFFHQQCKYYSRLCATPRDTIENVIHLSFF